MVTGATGTSRQGHGPSGTARTPRRGHGPRGTARIRAHEDPAADPAAVRSLMSRQLRLAAMTSGLLVALIGPLPLAFRALPDAATRPGGALVVWAVLGVAAYPALLLIGRWYVVHAERNERDAGDPTGRA
ncbi:hypothetical protein GCM10010503_54940 [Streptomyces lucensis JCM 4490]|uniref:Uncharacterized protein n=1 Tax=Streptomyces lucensis JCM 4490 TaxID=1306176 RepID=A0A918MUF1_9ACTN|nr:hypothetical protein GCM10010503_54940 [Streptomyces lucensis JCM 4490]